MLLTVVAVSAYVVLRGTIGYTMADCVIESKSVEKWTNGNTSPWSLTTSCGKVDALDEAHWTTFEPGNTYDIRVTMWPFDDRPRLTL